jgi:hypothetical protein
MRDAVIICANGMVIVKTSDSGGKSVATVPCGAFLDPTTMQSNSQGVGVGVGEAEEATPSSCDISLPVRRSYSLFKKLDSVFKFGCYIKRHN